MKTIVKRLLAIIFASSAVYLVLLAYPQPLFAYELTAGDISVHSTQPIPDAMKATLEHLVQCCHGDDRPDCPIIDTLARDAGPAAPASGDGHARTAGLRPGRALSRP